MYAGLLAKYKLIVGIVVDGIEFVTNLCERI